MNQRLTIQVPFNSLPSYLTKEEEEEENKTDFIDKNIVQIMQNKHTNKNIIKYIYIKTKKRKR